MEAITMKGKIHGKNTFKDDRLGEKHEMLSWNTDYK